MALEVSLHCGGGGIRTAQDFDEPYTAYPYCGIVVFSGVQSVRRTSQLPIVKFGTAELFGHGFELAQSPRSKGLDSFIIRFRDVRTGLYQLAGHFRHEALSTD